MRTYCVDCGWVVPVLEADDQNDLQAVELTRHPGLRVDGAAEDEACHTLARVHTCEDVPQTSRKLLHDLLQELLATG